MLKVIDVEYSISKDNINIIFNLECDGKYLFTKKIILNEDGISSNTSIAEKRYIKNLCLEHNLDFTTYYNNDYLPFIKSLYSLYKNKNDFLEKRAKHMEFIKNINIREGNEVDIFNSDPQNILFTIRSEENNFINVYFDKKNIESISSIENINGIPVYHSYEFEESKEKEKEVVSYMKELEEKIKSLNKFRLIFLLN